MIFGLFKSGLKDNDNKDYIAVGEENGLELNPLATFIHQVIFDKNEDDEKE